MVVSYVPAPRKFERNSRRDTAAGAQVYCDNCCKFLSAAADRVPGACSANNNTIAKIVQHIFMRSHNKPANSLAARCAAYGAYCARPAIPNSNGIAVQYNPPYNLRKRTSRPTFYGRTRVFQAFPQFGRRHKVDAQGMLEEFTCCLDYGTFLRRI